MKKWLNWIALVIAFSVACGLLANWQFTRRAAKLATIELVQRNYSQAPVPIASLASDGDFKVPDDNWRSVVLQGHYLPETVLLVRNRPNDGQPGFEQLVAFESKDFGIVFVSRGWIPTGQKQDSPDYVPLLTETDMDLEAKVMSAEPELSRGAPSGQIASINIKLAEQETGIVTTFKTTYLRMANENPAQPQTIKPMPKPSVEEGNNLSYAMQWILFALMAMLALVWRIRKDNKQSSESAPRVKRTKKSELDAQYEDSITREK